MHAAAPVATDVTITGTTEVGFQLTGNYTYSDADGDPESGTTFRWLRDGTGISGATGQTYTLVSADEGFEIVFEVTPGDGTAESPGSPVQSLPVGPIAAANSAPTATDVVISGTPQVGETLTGAYVYDDADGDPQGASTFRWLRDGIAIPGATDITYVVAPSDKERTLRFEVTPVAQSGESPGDPVTSAGLLISNIAPSITGQNVVETLEDTAREIVLADLVIDDPDDNDCKTTLDCTLSVFDGTNYTRSGNTITPASNFNGTLTVPVRVNDGVDDSGIFNLAVSVIAVNDVPSADQQSVSTAEDTPIGITLTGSDPEGSALSFAIASTPSNGVLSGTPPNIIYTPNVNFSGSDSFTFTVSDGVLTSSPATVSISVSADNDAPTADPQSVSTLEDTPLAITLTGSDPENSTLEFAIATPPSNGTLSGTPPNVTYTPNADFNGPDSFSFTVSDGELTSPAAAVSITVEAQPDAPVVSITSPPDGSSFGSNTPIDFAATATDIEDGTLTASISWSSDLDGPLASGGSISVSTLSQGTHIITASVTDSDGVSGSDQVSVTITNTAPTATNVTIAGTPQVGETLTGEYVYNDAEGDPEGVTTFRWLRNGSAIPNATGQTYVVASPDKERTLQFEVTPVAQSGVSPGEPVVSAGLLVSNTAPSITGQNPVEIQEDTSREIVLADLIVNDLDDNNCQSTDDCTVSVLDGENYTRVGNTITPALNFDQGLTVPVLVTDSTGADSAPFNLTVTVVPVNDAPVITGLAAPLSTPEDTPLTIRLEDLVVSDPDNTFPTDFVLVLQDGLNYTRSGINGNTITPAENFNGTLTIPATVSDLEPLASPVFNITVTVSSENDVPSADTPIEPQTAIENTPFQLDVSSNFSDADGDTLTYSATGLPASLVINRETGVISGTPRFEDARDNEPYPVIVTAQDPLGAFATSEFELTVSALDRANLALVIDVNSNSASPAEDLRWTFSAINPVGPQPGQDVELVGSFVGAGLAVTAEPGANCTIDPPAGNLTNFTCVLGALPVGATVSTVLTTTTSEASEVVAFATAAGRDNLPIDPNEEDNSAFEAAGVAEAFSNGAVQFLGATTALSVTAGDLNGDGRSDIVVGTQAGQPVQIYFGDVPRDSCECPRDFVGAPVPVSNTAANEGVALGDFDGNGSLDLVVATGGGLADVVYLNNGTGDFSAVTPVGLGVSFAHDVAVGDFNGDGALDVVVAAVGGNPVFLGNGSGGFTLEGALGAANSADVAVADLDRDGLDDLVFANTGGPSQVWLRSAAGGFAAGSTLAIGDASSVAAANLDAVSGPDLVFGRVPTTVGDVPSNPVLLNDGNGGFGAPSQRLGLSPTNDVQIGEINGDGLPDIVFLNASGVHQIWTAGAGGYVLHREQIIDAGVRAGVVTDLGFTDNGNPGGNDLAMGGANLAGIGVYLNDGAGNLGRGDAVPPVIELLGQAAVEVPSGSSYSDAGATASDNIDGDISRQIVVTGDVNTAVVGSYTLTYNVADFAGNQAAQVVRTVSVTPAIGTGGGGGGSLSLALLVALLGLLVAHELLPRHDGGSARLTIRIRKEGRHD